MMKRENMWKAVIAGALLLTIVATGVTLYNTSEDGKKKQSDGQELVQKDGEEDVDDNSFESQDASNGSVGAENYGADDKVKNSDEDTNSKPLDKSDEDDNKVTSGDVLPEINFSEDSVMVWPVNGKVLIDYSMETTTYFATLNQYKCCNGIVVGAEIGTAVQAAANGKVVSIVENEETGMTVTMDLGNGYYAIYGQLKGLRAKVGDIVEKGVILGYVEEPTKYFVKEGANLYFALNKSGEYVDPMIYLETTVE